MAEHRENRIKNISGVRFGSLLVIGFHDRITTPCGSIKTRYLCLCDCGNELITKRGNLVNGYTTSCGCSVSKILAERNKKHGMTGTKTYRCWRNMISRCTDPKNKAFKHYGGRGITVCEKWQESFSNFHSDMGTCPDGMSIDRIDNNGGYNKDNCRWVGQTTQMNNTRSNNVVFFNDCEITVADLAREIGINYYTLHTWIKRKGMTVEQCLERHRGYIKQEKSNG